MAAAIKTNPRLSLLAITWPIFIELFLHMIMGSTDTIMLSHISDNAVAAVGVANQLIGFCILIFGFVSSGTAVVLSQYLGAGLKDEVKTVTAISMTLNLVIGMVISLSMVVFREPLLGFFHLTADIKEMASAYLLLVGGTIFLQALLQTVSAILRANGFTREAMLCSVFMNIIHLVGNSLFIYGLLGIPQMGVTGVAISTIISRALALGLIVYLLYKLVPINIKLKDYITFEVSHLKKIMQIGIPGASEQLIFNVMHMVITAFIAVLGAAALTTRIYTMNINSYILLFGLAMGQGTQILIGYMVGARKFEKAYQQLLKSLKYSFSITIAVAAVVTVFREDLVGIFTDDPEIISVGGKLLLLSLVLEPGRTFNLVVISALRATGDAVFPVKMGVLSAWGVCVPLAYYLGIHLGYGLPGIWVAMTIDEWTRGIIMYFRWKSRAWEKKVLVGEVQSTA